jgi:hypothetical protein
MAASEGGKEEVSGVVLMRVENWDMALMDVIERHQGAPYSAGVSDCFTMAMECIEAVTGVRPYANVKYRTDAKGAAIMRKRGFKGLDEAVAALFPDRPRGFVMRGDIAVMDGTAGPTLGIVISGGVAWKNDRVRVLPLGEAVRFFAVD